MAISLIAVLVSGGVLGGLILLFRQEQKKKVRYASTFRNRMDYGVRQGRVYVDRLHPRINEHTLRQSFHYILHSFLAFLLKLIQRLEGILRFFVRINKARATQHVRKPSSDSHLATVREHKDSAKLSDEEKQKLSDEALAGR